MEVINTYNSPYNFEERLRPLFDAMCAGETIKSVTIDGEENFTIRNFKGECCWIATQNGNGKNYDYIDTNLKEERQSGFFMHHVISFEL